jgi:hypothetical protein
VFPLLCLTQEDLELWDEDPVEYIHKKIGTAFISGLTTDVYEEYLTPDIAANQFLITLARKRQKTSFNGILQFINTTLSLYFHTYPANPVRTTTNIPNVKKQHFA